MENFPDNQNNNSESEKPKAAEKVSFKNKLKRIFGTSAAIGATALMVGCGKTGGDANAVNNPNPTPDSSNPDIESNIEDSGITTSGDVVLPGIDDDGNTGGDVVDGDEDSEWKVNPEQFWEGDTFHMDEYIEALGGNTRASNTVFHYSDECYSTFDYETSEISIHIDDTSDAIYLNHDGHFSGDDVKVEYHDNIKSYSQSILDDKVAALNFLASADKDNILDYENSLPSHWVE